METGHQKYAIKVSTKLKQSRFLQQKLQAVLGEQVIYFKAQKYSARFSTLTLSTLSDKLKACCENILTSTNETLLKVRVQLKKTLDFVTKIVHGISLLDVLFAFTFLIRNNPVFSRPILSEDQFRVLRVEGLRNPLKFQIQKESYLPSMGNFSDKYSLFEGSPLEVIVGDSLFQTRYLRKLALSIILAHIGCFVPADYALFPFFSQIVSKLSVIYSSEQLASHLKTELLR